MRGALTSGDLEVVWTWETPYLVLQVKTSSLVRMFARSGGIVSGSFRLCGKRGIGIRVSRSIQIRDSDGTTLFLVRASSSENGSLNVAVRTLGAQLMCLGERVSGDAQVFTFLRLCRSTYTGQVTPRR